MATRRRIGVSAATTEAARRQLMQPVPCWERTWQNIPGTSVKIYKWVKTDKFPQFGEDEGTVDEPLAPLDIPDEPEGDEEDTENANNAAPKESVAPSELPSKQPSPTPKPDAEPEAEDEPEPTTLSMAVDEEGGNTSGLTLETATGVDASEEDGLKEGHEGLGAVGDHDAAGVGIDLQIEGLGPDGLPFESQHELSQVEPGDGLLGGLMMDASGIDPFSAASDEKDMSG